MTKPTITLLSQLNNSTLKIAKRSALYLIYTLLLVAIISNHAIALSASTTKVIEGSAPYLSIDGGATKVISGEGLLSIKLSDGRQYIAPGANTGLYPDAIVDNSSVTKPIQLPSEIKTFADIQTLVPLINNTNYPSIDLNSLINVPYNYWGDIDGDGVVSAIGNLTVTWHDANNQDITAEIKANPQKKLTLCDNSVPYRLTITASDAQLSTQYGVPTTRIFNNTTHTYYLMPNLDLSAACYAQPNLSYDNVNLGDQDFGLNGPNWVSHKGFKVLDADALSNNFPTTGTNGLHFFLLLTAITPEQVIAANGSSVKAESGSGVTLSLSSEQTNWWQNMAPNFEGFIVTGLKIKLNGPRSNSTNKHFTPSVFKLYADSSHTHLLYSFKIERWYIANLESSSNYLGDTFEEAQTFCQNLGNGYRMPGVEDYTNTNSEDGSWKGGIPGRDGGLWGNFYQRRVSYKIGNRWIGGLFSEWGAVSDVQLDYDVPEWSGSKNFWASQSHANDHYRVNGYDGYIFDSYSFSFQLSNAVSACVTP